MTILTSFVSYLTDKYFEEQLARIREIRASERKFYQKVTDLYATALDYDKNAKSTKRFYVTVQNKMHYAVHGHTAAELIVDRANSEKEHMGLTTWQDSPDGKIKITDVSIAKNYLSEFELNQLNRMVNSYLDFAENMSQLRTGSLCPITTNTSMSLNSCSSRKRANSNRV